MMRRPLGESGLEVSIVGLGTWTAGATVETWGVVDDRESIAAIHQALDCGINLIDTAPIYGLGHSEEIVGKALQGHRSDAVVATKCGLLFPERDDQLPPRCLSKSSILQQCDDSLRRLRIDVIDIYQCHWPDPETPISESMEALAALKQQGKIRAIGLSNFGVQRVTAALEFGIVDSVQPPFSILQPRSAEELIPFCRANSIGVIAYSPLCKGLLTGKFNAENTFDDVRARDPEFLGDRYRRNLGVVDELGKLAEKYEKTVAQLAINWLVGHPGVTAPIFGAKRPSQVIENVGGIGWAITEEDRALIDNLTRS